MNLTPLEITELASLTRQGDWNSQTVTVTENSVYYEDYDEGKAEGDHLSFVLRGDSWVVTEAMSAYGFDNGKGGDILENQIYSKDEVIALIKSHFESRSYIMA